MKTAFSLAATTFAALLACTQPAEAQLLGGAVGGAVNGTLGGSLGAGPGSLDGDLAGSGALRGTGTLDSDLPGRLRDRATTTGRTVTDRSTRAVGNTQQRARAVTGTAIERTEGAANTAAGIGGEALARTRSAANGLRTEAAAQAEGTGSLDLAGTMPSPGVNGLPALPAAAEAPGMTVPVPDNHEADASGEVTPSMALSNNSMNLATEGRAAGHAGADTSAAVAVEGSASASR